MRPATLVLFLFPPPGLSALLDFKTFLETALVADRASILVCDLPRTSPPKAVCDWLEHNASSWNGPLALFYWAGTDPIEQAASKLGTYDWKVPILRNARKVLMVNGLEQNLVMDQYSSLSSDGTSSPKPLLLMRAGPHTGILVQRELANYLGTRSQPRAQTQNLLAVGTPSKPPRGDQTVTGIQLTDPLTGKVKALAPPPPEDERPTQPPPPGTGPPEPVFTPRERNSRDDTPTR